MILSRWLLRFIHRSWRRSSPRPAVRPRTCRRYRPLMEPLEPRDAAAIGLVQNIGGGSTMIPGVLLIAIPAAGAAAGDSIIVEVADNALAAVVSVADSAGNAYSRDAVSTNAGNVRTEIFSAHNINALGAGGSITVSSDGAAGSMLASAAEFAGLVPTATLDQTATATGNSATPSSGLTGASSQAAELLLGGVGAASPPPASFTVGAGYAGLSGIVAGGLRLDAEFQIVSSVGPYQADGTFASDSVNTTIQQGGGGANEMQSIAFAAGGGNFTLTFGGQTTSLLAFDAPVNIVQRALELLPSIGFFNVSVSGEGGNYTITFQGALAGSNQPQITINSLTGQTVGATNTTSQPGGGRFNFNEVQAITYTATGGTFTLTFNAATTGNIAFNASAATVQAALEGLGTIGMGKVAVTGVPGNYTLTFQNGLGNTDVVQTTINAGGLVAGPMN